VLKAEVINDIIPVPGSVGYGTVGRTLRTSFLGRRRSFEAVALLRHRG
jgi:hypothetical protein